MIWPDIEKSLNANTQFPLLWLINEASAAPSALAVEPMQAVALRTIQEFISHATPSTPRAPA
jgi:hypothetical protein